MIPPRKLLLTPIFGMVMLEDTTPLRITTANLKYDLATLLHNNVCWPNFHIHSVDISRYDGLNVSAEVVSPWQVLSMFWVVGIGFAEADAQPAFCKGYRVSRCAGVVNFFAFWGNVA